MFKHVLFCRFYTVNWKHLTISYCVINFDLNKLHAKKTYVNYLMSEIATALLIRLLRNKYRLVRLDTTRNNLTYGCNSYCYSPIDVAVSYL